MAEGGLSVVAPTGAGPGHAIVGRSPALQRALKLVDCCAARDFPVLIVGESGTGKELFAREIHVRSGRKGPFLAINCGAVTATLIESELFGCERGAFTGATEMKKGLFEAASEGTLFLDEIGDMEPTLQVSLLRVLQEREVRRVGGRRAIPVNVRVVAATHRNLADLVGAGAFREDLFYRLNVFPIELPSLRERREDIPLLVESLARAIATRNGLPAPQFSNDTLRALTKREWPGNIRELQSVIERAVALRPDGPVDLGASTAMSADLDPLRQAARAGKSMEDIERAYIMAVLEEQGYHRARAARQLGISTNTLWRKLTEIGFYRQNGSGSGSGNGNGNGNGHLHGNGDGNGTGGTSHAS